MDAQPELALLAKALNEYGLEAILIGNMAAALHGAPVSTIDIDLLFRKTPRNSSGCSANATGCRSISWDTSTEDSLTKEYAAGPICTNSAAGSYFPRV